MLHVIPLKEKCIISKAKQNEMKPRKCEKPKPLVYFSISFQSYVSLLQELLNA